ncbi:MAG: SpoIIE family protein phosphatase [Melioribacteraceae bacterium]|nr:SpoIIE family protein phosphatase [Melioribacteraceae bacterium]
MEGQELNQIKSQLLWRKSKIQEAVSGHIVQMHLANLLKEVDSALERIDNGTYGMCVVCHDPIEKERLIIDPLIKVCLDHLTTNQQKELEDDLIVANSIQKAMLPKNDQQLKGFEIYFHYDAAGAVSGDYCDIIDPGADSDSLYFVLGDVSGKGIAASMLMTHLRAMFQSLIPLGLTIAQLIARASRLLCESTTSTHYATLICVKSNNKGTVEICNAGHCLPFYIGNTGVRKIESTGMPIGIFCESEYGLTTLNLDKDEMLLLYSDGLTEAMKKDELYGTERLEKFAFENRELSPKQFVEKLLIELKNFLAGNTRSDDLTIMAIKKL